MHFIILDLELTCWQGHAMNREQEIIEIGAYRLTGFGEWTSRFHAFVKPLTNPRLSAYCQDLTGITQPHIDSADTFPSVYEALTEWLEEESGSQVMGLWGSKDIPMLQAECRRYRLDTDLLPPGINLKEQFARIHRLPKQAGLLKALDIAGLEFEGEHHRALDDAFNTARLFQQYLDRWAY